jgi:2-(1,2-epoxy-1,2-dihydrophenyl)acetyl-CoA isomerase
VALGQAKRLLDASFNRDLPAQLAAEGEAGRICAATEDHKEGLAAANQRRAPKFVGR